MSDGTAGTGKRKSGRTRRPPRDLDAVEPAPAKKGKSEATLKREKQAKVKEEAARKTEVPNPSDPSAFIQAAQKACGEISVRFSCCSVVTWDFSPLIYGTFYRQLDYSRSEWSHRGRLFKRVLGINTVSSYRQDQYVVLYFCLRLFLPHECAYYCVYSYHGITSCRSCRGVVR